MRHVKLISWKPFQKYDLGAKPWLVIYEPSSSSSAHTMLSSADVVCSVVMSADVFQRTRIQIELQKSRNETLSKSSREEQHKSLW
jgi:hypothetical protein